MSVPALHFGESTLLDLFRRAAFIAMISSAISVAAHDEVLSFRINTAGEAEAVVSGLLWGGQCSEGQSVSSPERITVSGSTILISSPLLLSPTVCVPKPYEVMSYEVVASLGRLSVATYQVTWSVGFLRQFTGLLPIAALLPALPVPAMSATGIALCGLLLCGLAFLVRRPRV